MVQDHIKSLFEKSKRTSDIRIQQFPTFTKEVSQSNFVLSLTYVEAWVIPIEGTSTIEFS